MTGEIHETGPAAPPFLPSVLAALLLLSGTAPASAQQEEAASLGEALTGGEPSATLRYRFEHVADDAFPLDADASTLRTAVGYRTKPLKGVSVRIEFSNVVDLGSDGRYADAGVGASGNGVTDRPVVADPEMTRVHQVSAAFEKGATRIEAGRFTIDLDNQRFVGSVAWRQNQQSFAAARIVNRSVPRTTLGYAFLERAYTVTGGERPMSTHLFRAAADLGVGTGVGYAYLLDFESEADRGLSTATLGLRFSGRRDLEPLHVSYEAEYARQRDHGSNPGRVRADYYRIVAGVGMPRVAVEAGLEVLGGSRDEGRFTTPLATLHAFNGWIDAFLGTPPAGIEDLFLALGGALGPVSWRVVYHDFRAEAGPARYGDEIDLVATWRAPWKQQFGLKAGFYDAEELSTDAAKLWLWSAYSF